VVDAWIAMGWICLGIYRGRPRDGHVHTGHVTRRSQHSPSVCYVTWTCSLEQDSEVTQRAIGICGYKTRSTTRYEEYTGQKMPQLALAVALIG